MTSPSYSPPPACAGCAAGWPLERDRWSYPHRLLHVDPQSRLRWAWHGDTTTTEILLPDGGIP